MVKVNGHEYYVSILSAGDLPVLSALFEAAQPLVSEFEPGQVPSLIAMLPVAEHLIDTLAHLLNCPRDHIENLALHDLIDLTEQVAAQWMTLNAKYIADEVTPSIQRLARSLSTVAGTDNN